MYLVIRYGDGTLYTIAYWNWDANFYGKTWVAGTGIDPASKVSADVEWTRSNNDPTKTITPNIASVLIPTEIT